MTDTPNLNLPYLLAAQAQKHVTHNEAIRALDCVVQLSVLDRNLAAPPATPTNGARYLVAASPTGAWAGQAGKIAAFQDAAWMFYAPKKGWLSWVEDENILLVYDGAGWALLPGGGGGGGVTDHGLLTGLGDDDHPHYHNDARGDARYLPIAPAMVGINATADTTNRLAVGSAASLFSHAGSGGHQVKVNKAGATDTASQLFQSGFSGRAEVGLLGDDNLHFKVSADGATWKDALIVDRSTGIVSMPFTTFGGGREKLNATRTYYVRTNGSDANNGLANTAGGAFLTLQKAWNTIVGALDLGGQVVTVQIADGTYTSGLTIGSAWVGGGSVIFTGNAANSAAVHISPAAGQALFVNGPCPGDLRFVNLKMSAPAHTTIDVRAACMVSLQNFRFGTSLYGHVISEAPGSFVNMYLTPIHIEGGSGSAFVNVSTGAVISMNAVTLTLTGTPGFPGSFASAVGGGIIRASAFTFAGGSATGPRYFAAAGGIINTGGQATTYLPGNSAGSGTYF